MQQAPGRAEEVTLNRYAKRRDANESGIVATARRIGLKVFYTSDLGDLIVQHGDRTELWEVKTATGKLTEAQCKRRQAGLKAYEIRTDDDVLAARGRFIASSPADAYDEWTAR